MREREVAELMFRVGLEREIDVDNLVAELTTISLPSYLDAATFRGAVVDAVEPYLRAQLEERLNRMRQQFAGGRPIVGRVKSNPVPASTGSAGDGTRSSFVAPRGTAGDDAASDIEPLGDATINWEPKRE